MIRTELQKECDRIDLNLARAESALESLAELIKVAGPALRTAARKVSSARAEVRRYMHDADRKATPY